MDWYKKEAHEKASEPAQIVKLGTLFSLGSLVAGVARYDFDALVMVKSSEAEFCYMGWVSLA